MALSMGVDVRAASAEQRRAERAAKADEREPIPADIPRHGRDQRPQIRLADDPTRLAYYRRPSSFGDGIESTFALDRREGRLTIAALVRSPELYNRAAEVIGPHGPVTDWDALMADQQVKDGLAEVWAAGLKLLEAERRAALGTKLHGYRDRLDRDGPGALPFLGPQMWAALMAWSRLAAAFTWHGSEQFVVCDRWQTAGTYDALWSPKRTMHPPAAWDCPPLEPGQRVIVDLKSGHWVLKYGEIGRVIQLTQYPNGVPYVHLSDEEVAAWWDSHDETEPGRDGRGEWPDGIAPRTDVALIPHVPLDRPDEAGLIWVNLVAGATLSDLAVQVHEGRKLVGNLFAAVEVPAELAQECEQAAAEIGRVEAEQAQYERDLSLVEPELVDLPVEIEESDGAPEFVEPPGLVAGRVAPPSAREAIFDHLAAGRLLVAIREARFPTTLERLYVQNKATWGPAHSDAADAKLAELAAQPVAQHA
jgi:hypothetical protein